MSKGTSAPKSEGSRKTASGHPTPEAASPAIKTPSPRLYDLSESRADVFGFDPLLIEREEGFNSRTDFGDLESLASDIEANGLQKPLTVRKVGSSIVLVDGDRRLTAITTILIPLGRWPAGKNGKPRLAIPCISEGKGVSPLDRIFIQLSSNNSKPFTLLEKATAYQKAMALEPTLIASEIARRTGETKQAVSDALQLINSATSTLVDAIQHEIISASAALEIIRFAEKYDRGIDAVFEQAANNANRAGREKILPKDIGEKITHLAGSATAPIVADPEPFPYSWSYQRNDQNLLPLGLPEELEQNFAPEILTLHGLPEGSRFTFGWQTYEGGTTCGYYYTNGDAEAGTGFIPWDGKTEADLLDWHEEFTYALQRIRESAGIPLGQLPELLRLAVAARTSPPQPLVPEADSPGSSASTSAPPQIGPSFAAFLIDGAPIDPNQDGTYHESDRLVLLNPPPEIHLLQLLGALTERGPAYGYRIQLAGREKPIEFLPRADHRLTSNGVVTGYFAMLTEALATVQLPPGIAEPLSVALREATNRYYSDSGELQEPETIPYAPPKVAPAPADPGAIERIKSADSTNRDGSGVSLGNDGGFIDPSKRLKQLNEILEKLGDDEAEPTTSNQLIVADRVTMANLVYNFLMNEASPSSLKDRLTGKDLKR